MGGNLVELKGLDVSAVLDYGDFDSEIAKGVGFINLVKNFMVVLVQAHDHHTEFMGVEQAEILHRIAGGELLKFPPRRQGIFALGDGGDDADEVAGLNRQKMH